MCNLECDLMWCAEGEVLVIFCQSFPRWKQYQKYDSHDSTISVFLLSFFLLSDQNGDPHPLNSPLETFNPDPMLSGCDATPQEALMLYLNNPNLLDDLDNSDILEGDSALLPDFTLSEFHCLTPQPCGSIFQ